MRQPTAETKSIDYQTKLVEASLRNSTQRRQISNLFYSTKRVNPAMAGSTHSMNCVDESLPTEIHRFAARRSAPVQNAYKPSAFFSQPFSPTRQSKLVKIKKNQTRDLISDFARNVSVCPFLSKPHLP
jgi:hypothetical protein